MQTQNQSVTNSHSVLSYAELSASPHFNVCNK